MRRMRTEDGGFTLIEMLMAIVIMGIITVPIGDFMLAYLANFSTTQNRLSDSSDIQLATAYFSQDVANTGLRANVAPYGPAQSVWTQSPWPGPSYCGQGLGTTVLLLRWGTWDQTTETLLPASAAYVQEGTTLHRIFCQASPTDLTGVQPISDATVVHNLVSATPQCFTSAPETVTACDSAAPPPKVVLSLGISSATSGNTDLAAPQQPVTLVGQRRQS